MPGDARLVGAKLLDLCRLEKPEIVEHRTKIPLRVLSKSAQLLVSFDAPSPTGRSAFLTAQRSDEPFMGRQPGVRDHTRRAFFYAVFVALLITHAALDSVERADPEFSGHLARFNEHRDAFQLIASTKH
jgi:hypothetical protein